MKFMKKKITYIVMALVMISVACFAALSFTLADVPADPEKPAEAVQNAGEVVKTNIDYIVEKATPDSPYAIVEIGSSGTPSALQAMVTGTGKTFEKLVINGYSVTGDMQPDSISYNYYYYTGGKWYNINGDADAAAVTDADAVTEADVVDAVSHADFLYVSNDPNKMYDASNDIPENVKIALSSAATGTYTPIMIDSHEKTIINQSQAATTINTLVSQIFRASGSSYATFSFAAGETDATNLMDLSKSTRAFTAINGYNQIQNGIWEAYPKGTVDAGTFKPADDGSSYYVARVLSVGTGTSGFTTSMKMGLSPVTTAPTDVDPANPISTTNLYGYADDIIWSGATMHFGYYRRYEKPDFVRFDTVAANALNTVDLQSYDFVIFEGGIGTTTLSETDYNACQAAMLGNVHILYDESLITQDVISGGGGLSDANNYNYVYNKVATATGSGRYGNVLVLSRAKTQAYSMATKAKTVKPVADIIINGSFRGIKGNDGGDSASNVYTVLEIQPSYPIDTTLAAQLGVVKGWTDPDTGKSFALGSNRNERMQGLGLNASEGYYYMRTASTSNLTPDEISYDGVTPLSEMIESGDFQGSIKTDNLANITDYYKWTLSKAKIAHATGKDYNQVKVVHMSSQEFNSSKKTLIDNYDAIFIGGDYSGLKPSNMWTNNTEMYLMYFHNGDTYSYPNRSYGYMANYNGVVTGNDITADKMRELNDYVDAGMPVIISDEVTKAYLNAGADHMIDPNSNMFAFLKKACDPAKAFVPGASDGNVITYFDDVVIRIPNVDNQYGVTFGGYVTVFAGNETEDYKGNDVTKHDPDRVDEQQLSLLLQKVSRPKLAVTSMPTNYVEGDPSSWVDGPDLTFKYEAFGGTGSFHAELFFDENSNSRFEDEQPKDSSDDKSGTLSFTVDSDFFGPVYWKVKVTDTATGAACSVTGLCKVKRTNQEKMRVELLEIAPTSAYQDPNDQDKSTLFLCSECQQSSYCLTDQRSCANSKYEGDTMVGLNAGFKYSNKPKDYFKNNLPSTDSVVKLIQKDDSSYEYTAGILGVHSHRFGIPVYDDKLHSISQQGTYEDGDGLDDWNKNWFDEVTYDYDVDVTIYSADMLDELVGRVNSYYASYYNPSNTAQENQEALSNARSSFYSDKTKYFELYRAMTKLIDGELTSGSAEYTLLSDWFVSVGADPSLMSSYGTVGSRLDTYLNSINPDDYSTQNLTLALTEEIAYETDPDISYSRRGYYDFFSLQNAPSDSGPYVGFMPLYAEWRDAKIIEQYFRQKYLDNSLMAGVNYDITGSGNDSQYAGKINLSSTFNCICIGAADDFGGDGDISVRGCNALIDYADDGGSVFMFHDTITANKNNTKNMSELLRTAFGQNHRHDYLDDTAGRSARNHNFTISVDGQNINYEMGSGIETATVNLSQKAGPITASQNSVTITLGDGTTKNMPATFSNTDGGYTFEVEKTVQKIDAITLDVYGVYGNAYYFVKADSIVIPPSVTEVVLDCTYGDYNGDNPTVKVLSKSGANFAPHPITIRFNIYSTKNNSRRTYSDPFKIGLNGNTSSFLDAYDGGYITVQSTETGSSGQVEQATYNIDNGTKVSPDLTGNGQQIFTVHVTNSADGNAVAGETINYSVNGSSGSVKTDASGNAVFTRTNYSVTSIDSNISESALADQWTQNQSIVFEYKDVTGSPVIGKTINVADVTTGESYSVTTNAEGKAALSGLYNYTVNTAGAEYKINTSGTDGTDYRLSPSSRKLTPIGLTIAYVMPDTGDWTGGAPSGSYQFMFNYVSWKTNVHANNQTLHVDADERGMYDGSHITTDRAEQLNEGIVTLYPFNIGSNLKVANTTPQGFALDTEDPDLICYYALAGGNQGSMSSYFAADPHDGTNNYFIYQKGTVTYTGAGHGNVTGRGRNNNDERRLFINVILNSARKSTAGTQLTLHDETSTYDGKDTKTLTNDIVKKDESGLADYYINITDTSTLPTFSFLPKTDTSAGVTVQQVKIYYDLDHDDEYEIERDASGKKIYERDASGNTVPKYKLNSAGQKIPCKNIFNTYTTGQSDVLIFTSAADSARQIGSNLLRRINHDATDMFNYVGLQEVLTTNGVLTSNLNLKQEYFNELGYCYIVVEVTDSKNRVVKRTIRLALAPELQHLN